MPAFSGLFAPYWQSDARGVIVGLTRYVNTGHIARAALEATAFQTREVARRDERRTRASRSTALKVDGGMVVNETADAVPGRHPRRAGRPARRSPRRPRSARPTRPAWRPASGTSEEDLRQNWAEDKRWEPQMDADASATEPYRYWKKAVTRTFDWLD